MYYILHCDKFLSRKLTYLSRGGPHLQSPHRVDGNGRGQGGGVELLEPIDGGYGHAPGDDEAGGLGVAGRAQEDDPVGGEEDLAVCRQHEAIVATVGKEVGMDAVLEEENFAVNQRRLDHLGLGRVQHKTLTW